MPTAYAWRVLRAGEFRLDGGSMFGLIPRSVWSRSVPTDELGRITVQHNCLLLERVGDGEGPARVLIETGSGDKLDAASKGLFAMQERSVLDALREVDVAPESIGAVLVSHLHFDHAGGLTRLCREGETPDWVGPAGGMAGSRGEHGVKRTFPAAKVFVQRREWEDALAQRSVMTRTYFADHVQAVEKQVVLLDAPAPYPIGAAPRRGDQPMLTFEQRCVEAAPGIVTFRVPGHTWGQQAILFTDDRGRSVVFAGDALPTRAHAGATYSLAYDVEAYTSMLTKSWLLEHAARLGWVLVLDHETGNPCVTVRANGKGWYDLVPVD